MDECLFSIRIIDDMDETEGSYFRADTYEGIAKYVYEFLRENPGFQCGDTIVIKYEGR